MVNITLSGPAAVVAALPRLLGFVPAESLVIVWIADERVALTQRVDLPSGGIDDYVGTVVTTARHAAPDAAVVVLVTGREDPLHLELVDAIEEALAAADVDCRDVLRVHGDRYWSYRCMGDCCPAEGRLVDDEVRAAVEAALDAEPASSREALAASLGPDPHVVSRLEPRIIDLEESLDTELAAPGRALLESWRDRQIERLSVQLAAGEALDDDAWCELLVSLGDVRVRDTLLWELARAIDHGPQLSLLTSGIRAAPEGYVAPVATMLALTAWLAGDGARASIALDRALEDDPDYALAILASRSLHSGMPPESWRGMMTAMSRAQCRVPPPAA